jgi:hypothetical protein
LGAGNLRANPHTLGRHRHYDTNAGNRPQPFGYKIYAELHNAKTGQFAPAQGEQGDLPFNQIEQRKDATDKFHHSQKDRGPTPRRAQLENHNL